MTSVSIIPPTIVPPTTFGLAPTFTFMGSGIGGAGTGERGEKLEMAASESEFNSGEIGAGRGISVGRAGVGGTLGSICWGT